MYDIEKFDDNSYWPKKSHHNFLNTPQIELPLDNSSVVSDKPEWMNYNSKLTSGYEDFYYPSIFLHEHIVDKSCFENHFHEDNYLSKFDIEMMQGFNDRNKHHNKSTRFPEHPAMLHSIDYSEEPLSMLVQFQKNADSITRIQHHEKHHLNSMWENGSFMMNLPVKSDSDAAKKDPLWEKSNRQAAMPGPSGCAALTRMISVINSAAINADLTAWRMDRKLDEQQADAQEAIAQSVANFPKLEFKI